MSLGNKVLWIDLNLTNLWASIIEGTPPHRPTLILPSEPNQMNLPPVLWKTTKGPYPWTFYSVQPVVSSAVMFALYPFPPGLTWEHFAARPFHTISMRDGHYFSKETLAARHWKVGNEEGLSNMCDKRLMQHAANSLPPYPPPQEAPPNPFRNQLISNWK